MFRKPCNHLLVENTALFFANSVIINVVQSWVMHLLLKCGGLTWFININLKLSYKLSV